MPRISIRLLMPDLHAKNKLITIYRPTAVNLKGLKIIIIIKENLEIVIVQNFLAFKLFTKIARGIFFLINMA